jgi:hypothetical protein
VAIAVLCTAGSSGAQAPEAGRVTHLEGVAAVARASLPQGAALKERDSVYLADLVTTAEQSRAQLLLARKAIVTIREKSVLRITEAPGTGTIELTSGKVKVQVANGSLAPGDKVEVRTPTAITAVRGTTWIVESEITPAGPVSHVTVLEGIVDVTPLDPTTRAPRGPVVKVNPLQRFSVGGSGAPAAPQPITRAEADALGATFAFGLKANSTTDSDLLRKQLDQAAADAAAAQKASSSGDLLGSQGGGRGVSGDDLRSRGGGGPVTGGGGGGSGGSTINSFTGR